MIKKRSVVAYSEFPVHQRKAQIPDRKRTNREAEASHCCVEVGAVSDAVNILAKLNYLHVGGCPRLRVCWMKC